MYGRNYVWCSGTGWSQRELWWKWLTDKKLCPYFWDIRLFVSPSILWEFAREINFLPSNPRLPPVKLPLPGLFITRRPLANANESLGDKWIWRTPCKPWLLLSAAPPIAHAAPRPKSPCLFLFSNSFMSLTLLPCSHLILTQFSSSHFIKSLPSLPTSFCQLLYIPIVICGF